MPPTTPADSNGTFSIAIAGTPSKFGVANHDAGTGIWYQQNAAAGTHTITPENLSATQHYTLLEISGAPTSGALDKVVDAKTDNTSHQTQVTGTTAETAQPGELVVIGVGIGATNGISNINLVDPPAGFTTLYKMNNSASDLATLHAYKFIIGAGPQSATFDWVDSETEQASHADLATFLVSSDSLPGQTMQ